MIFWVIVGGLCALAVGLLVLPLLRRPGESAPRAAYDLNVYKDQLAEIAREMKDLAARAIVVVDENNKVVHTELVADIVQEPNYDAAIAAVS